MDKPNPGDISHLLGDDYAQYLLKQAVHRSTREYWDVRRSPIAALIGIVGVALGYLGYETLDYINLKDRLDEAQTQLVEVRQLSRRLEEAAGQAEAKSQIIEARANGAMESAAQIRSLMDEAFANSRLMFDDAVKRSNDLKTITIQQFEANKNAGDAYVEAAGAMVTALEKRNLELNGSISNVETTIRNAKEAIVAAQSAATTAQTTLNQATELRKSADDYRNAVNTIGSLQQQLAITRNTETVTVLSVNRKDSSFSRPTVRMRSAQDPSVEYVFTFRMLSPGNGLELVATVARADSDSRTEQVCVRSPDSSKVYGRYFKLGSSPFFMKPDFVYQAALANDFVLLRLMAEVPAAGSAGLPTDCSELKLAAK